MGALAWVMMAIAIWHFTVFLPDRFWGGIVGAFVGCVIGAVVFGLVISGGIPARDDTSLLTAFETIPGVIAGLAVVWFIGVRQERNAGIAGAH